MKYAVEAKQLEEEGDAIYHEALGQLFEKEHDAIELIKWKEIYDDLEGTLDQAEDVANVVESINDQARLMPASVWFVLAILLVASPSTSSTAFTTRRTPSPRSCHARAVAERRGGVAAFWNFVRGVRLRHRHREDRGQGPDRPERRRFDCGSRRPAGSDSSGISSHGGSACRRRRPMRSSAVCRRCGRQSGICRVIANGWPTTARRSGRATPA